MYSYEDWIRAVEPYIRLGKCARVICANWGDYSLEPSRSSFAMHCMLAKHYLNGAHYPVGGGMAFSRLIAPIIEEAGGALLLLHSAEVSEVLVNDGVAQGVLLSSRSAAQ